MKKPILLLLLLAVTLLSCNSNDNEDIDYQDVTRIEEIPEGDIEISSDDVQKLLPHTGFSRKLHDEVDSLYADHSYTSIWLNNQQILASAKHLLAALGNSVEHWL